MNGLRLNEKIIIVTGAAGGLGQAMIEGLLMEGATILAVDQNEAKLQRIHNSYKSKNIFHL